MDNPIGQINNKPRNRTPSKFLEHIGFRETRLFVSDQAFIQRGSEVCRRRRGQRHWPIPLPPTQLGYVAAAKARHIEGLPFVDIPFDAADTLGNRVVFEKPFVIVIDELDRQQRQFLKPSGRRFRAIEVDGACRLREVVGVTSYPRGSLTVLRIRGQTG
jgi:hypothetical protein